MVSDLLTCGAVGRSLFILLSSFELALAPWLVITTTRPFTFNESSVFTSKVETRFIREGINLERTSSLGTYLGALRHPISRIVVLQELTVYGCHSNVLSIHYLLSTMWVHLADNIRSFPFWSKLASCLVGHDDWPFQRKHLIPGLERVRMNLFVERSC